MFEEILKKVVRRESITKKEAQFFLSKLCSDIRKNNGIVNPLDPECKVCYETSMEFGRIAYMKLGCDVESLNLKADLGIPLTHYANFINLDVNGEVKTYLVDMTYSQFFGKTITLDNNVKVYSRSSVSLLEKEPFVEELRKNGFIELKGNILKKYVDGFLTICKMNDDRLEVYKKINKKVHTGKINTYSR